MASYDCVIVNRDMGKKMIKLLVNLLVTIDDDSRYQSHQQRNRIASLFFPTITLVLEASRPDPGSNGEGHAVS
jgi:hypothetical protein